MTTGNQEGQCPRLLPAEPPFVDLPDFDATGLGNVGLLSTTV